MTYIYIYIYIYIYPKLYKAMHNMHKYIQSYVACFNDTTLPTYEFLLHDCLELYIYVNYLNAIPSTL